MAVILDPCDVAIAGGLKSLSVKSSREKHAKAAILGELTGERALGAGVFRFGETGRVHSMHHK